MTKSQNEELINLNAQLKETQFNLVQSEKLAALGELASGISHEFNNNIGYVESNLETMSNYLTKMCEFINFSVDELSKSLRSNSNPENDRLCKLICENHKKNKIAFIVDDIDSLIHDSLTGVKNITEIINHFKSFAKTGFEDVKTLYPLTDIIDQVLLLIKNDSKKNIDIIINISKLIDIYCNKIQLSQALLNIMLNSIHAINSIDREDKGIISLSTYTKNNYTCISIKDNGPGISNDMISKIFNPFYTTKDIGQGMGLGLSITHDIIVRKHNGVLDVKSNYGSGTEFIIKLPLPNYMYQE
jgi:signal transduction histidine kinase